MFSCGRASICSCVVAEVLYVKVDAQGRGESWCARDLFRRYAWDCARRELKDESWERVPTDELVETAVFLRVLVGLRLLAIPRMPLLEMVKLMRPSSFGGGC